MLNTIKQIEKDIKIEKWLHADLELIFIENMLKTISLSSEEDSGIDVCFEVKLVNPTFETESFLKKYNTDHIFGSGNTNFQEIEEKFKKLLKKICTENKIQFTEEKELTIQGTS